MPKPNDPKLLASVFSPELQLLLKKELPFLLIKQDMPFAKHRYHVGSRGQIAKPFVAEGVDPDLGRYIVMSGNAMPILLAALGSCGKIAKQMANKGDNPEARQMLEILEQAYRYATEEAIDAAAER